MAQPHQHILGELSTWEPGLTGRVIFVSHEWLGFSNADPSFQQLGALKQILSRLMSGDVPTVQTCWLDAVAGVKLVVKADQWVGALPTMFL